MVSAWRADTKDTLPADTTNVFCSSVFRAAEVAVTAGSAEATAWPGRHDGGWARRGLGGAAAAAFVVGEVMLE
jgi:hypothetical protein